MSGIRDSLGTVLHSKSRCRLRCMIDITFSRPFPVSSLVKMHAHVAYNEMNYMEIVVVNETCNAVSSEHDISNVLSHLHK